MGKIKVNTFREWLDDKNLTVDKFVYALIDKHGNMPVSTSTANKWASSEWAPDSIHVAAKMVILQKFPDFPL